MRDRRELLKAIAVKMLAKSADLHARGMHWAGNSGRIDQFSYLCTDAEVAELCRLLLEDGLVEMVDGEPVIHDVGEPSARLDIRITSGGGNS